MEELICKYDSRKSFYKKAMIEKIGEGTINLYSYDTLVASYNTNSKDFKIFNMKSQTTVRHIKEFMYQYAIPYSVLSTKELKEKYLVK